MAADVDRPKRVEKVNRKCRGEQVCSDVGPPEAHKAAEHPLGDRHGYDQNHMAAEVAEHEREQHQRTHDPGARANEPCKRNHARNVSRLRHGDPVG